jgi:anti-sigma factor ChrR (cupin superfamily)
MKLRADFTKRACVLPDDYEWVASPVAGVDRMMLDRIGDEVARATSLVKYAANSRFPEHVHGGGEEIFVIDGEFADEHGSYPAGTYVRNPIGTKHAPSVGPQGCTIFVKLHQFDAGDTRRFAVDTNNREWKASRAAGVEIMPLHRFGRENVELVRFEPDATYPRHVHEGGEEVLVLAGAIRDADGVYPQGTWLRFPDGSEHDVTSSGEGALLYVKEGHLLMS